MKRKLMIASVLSMVLVLALALSLNAAELDAKTGAAAQTAPPVTEAVMEQTAAAENPSDMAFRCYTFDVHGNPLDGYWSENDGVWYMFVTSKQVIGDTALYYTGTVSKTSAGVLDAENRTVTGAFSNSGDTLELTTADGAVHTVIMMQSDLPSVHIVLGETTLDEIHANQDEKHGGNSIYIMDPGDAYDLTVQSAVEIKGRGNSSWREYEKKAYQIRFDNETNVMGMGKAKKWVLLANASDDSMMRTQLVYNMAKKLDMAFVPGMRYVDLWIDGEYRGTFQMGDKVEIGADRLALLNGAGAIFEQDEAFYAEEAYGFYSNRLQRHFVLKEIVEENNALIAKAMTGFEEAVEELAAYLLSTPSYEVTLEDLSQMIDVDSFAKYYLVNEYVLNRESFVTSFYWYKDGSHDVIHLGPIWDFDTCMGNDGAAHTESYGENHVLFRYLLAAPEFRQRVLELLEIYREDFASMTADADAIQAEIAASAEMNYLRWDVLGKPNPKGGTVFSPTFDGAVHAVQSWLRGREAGFRVAECLVATSSISEDYCSMEVCFQDDEPHTLVEFAVWSLTGEQDDLAWYTAQENADGSWRYNVDLTQHRSDGIYRILVYTDGNRNDAAVNGYTYVKEARKNIYEISLEFSDSGKTVMISMNDSKKFDNMIFAVWSEENEQDDVIWYTAARNRKGGRPWQCSVDLTNHQTIGLVNIHAYSEVDGVLTRISKDAVNLAGVEMETSESGSVFRLYNPDTGEHLYTCSAEEGKTLIGEGWNYEGIAWLSPVKDGLPIYRVYNPNTGGRHYSGSIEEVNALVEAGWHSEGICWNTPVSGIPVYRLYNPNAVYGSHHYTTSDEEREYLLGLGWQYEGVSWNGIG